MKRTKLYTLLIVYSSLFGACVSGETPEEILPVETNGVYLNLEFRQTNTPSTRTDGDYKENGTAAESYLSNATIVLENATTGELTQIRQNVINWIDTNQDDVFKTQPVKIIVPDGKYWLYIVANATHADGSSFLSVLSPGSDFSGSYSLGTKEACIKFWDDEHFVMTNVQNDISENTPGKGSVEIDLEAGKHTADYPLTVKVNLDRLAVKITAAPANNMQSAFIGNKLKASDGKSYTIGNVEIDGTALLNCVTRFNLIQVWKKGRNFTTTDRRDMLLNSPSSYTTYPFTDYYNRIRDMVSGNQVNTSGLFVSPGTPMYCLENNSPYYSDLGGNNLNALENTKMKGRTTAVLFRVKAELQQQPSGNNIEQTFYRYKKVFYADIVAMIEAHPDLKQLHVGPGSSASDLRAKGVEVFENGHMYYLYWIKDSNYTDQSLPYYSVMRNTWYGLTVSKINQIGDDVPGGNDYDPEDPIDVEYNYNIDVAITVKGWTIKDISHPVM